MQNIIYLIGIIKGINFDGLINNKEIAYLQYWVDNNRNIAYGNDQIKLIKLIDSVLEDHKIDENENCMILSMCNEFLKETNYNSSAILELNGIIKGIICDNEVNKIEMIHLKEWIKLYGDSIQTYKSSIKLCKAIDNILEDYIVTKEEQIEMLDLLNEISRNVQLENKLSYLFKLVKEKKNIGVDLIDILNNQYAMQEIHIMAENKLIQAIRSYSGDCMNPEIIIVSLVLIAMLEYDGNYYANVKATYKELYDKFSEQKIEGMIRSILSKYKNQSESFNRNRLINVALENAIVPQTFLSAFFEFVFDIYKLNFVYDLPEDLYEDFRFVFDGLRKNMLSKGDDVLINVTQKTYKLIASTKHLIREKDGLDALIKLSIIIVKLIDLRYWDKEVNIINPYLKLGFEGWEKRLKEDAKHGYERKKSYSEFRSRWESKFIMLNNSVYLNPPVHKVKSQYDYRDIVVVILNDNQEIYRNDRCDIREIIGGYEVNMEKIPISNPLGKLTYKLVAKDEIIYDSKEKLYRNYIVFNSEGKEISNNTDFEGTAYIAYRKGQADLYNIYTNENYYIGYKLVRLGDAIEIGLDVFNFSSMAKPGVFGQIYKNCYVKEEGKEMLLPIYHDTCFIVFEADNSSNKFEISINGKSHKLKDMQYNATNKKSTTKYVVDLGIYESDIYNVTVNQLESASITNILQSKFAFDTKLVYSKELIDESSYIVHISSSLANFSLDKQITIKEFTPDFIKFENNGCNYIYYIPFDFGLFKLSKFEWFSKNGDIWIDDINYDSILTIYDSQCDGLLLYNENDKLVEEDFKLIDNGYYKQLRIFFLSSYKNSDRYVDLLFTASGKVKYRLRCYNKCIINKEKTEILCFDNSNKVKITPIFNGRNKIFYEIYNSTGNKIFTSSKYLDSGQTSILKNLKSFQKYKIQFHEKVKSFQTKKNSPLFEVYRTFYFRKDFINRSFKISEICIEQEQKGQLIKTKFKLKNYYVKFVEINDTKKDLFKGQIYYKLNKVDHYLSNINPVDVEIYSDVIDGIMDIYMTNQGDGLLFNINNIEIINSMEDHLSPDILSFKINMKGEE